VKKLIKLALFFSISFAILFLVAAGMRFLAIRVEWVKSLSNQPQAVLTGLIAAVRWALPLALYGGMLLGLSYAVRYKVFAPLAIPCMLALSAVFVCGVTILAKNWENIPPEKNLPQHLGGPGLLLSNPNRQTGTVIVLLQGPAEPDRARVIAVPGRPLLHQAEYTGRDSISLPPAPFVDNTPWFLKSLAFDLRLSAENLQARFDQRSSAGLVPFLTYAGALIFLLSSFWFVMKFSAWPLANMCLGCLIFRGLLALETFFNSSEMQETFSSFFQNRLPASFVAPLIFCAFALLAHLYSFLEKKKKRQDRYED
jgi:hypothetical protein